VALATDLSLCRSQECEELYTNGPYQDRMTFLRRDKFTFHPNNSPFHECRHVEAIFRISSL
jgi:hypothetical protein